MLTQQNKQKGFTLVELAIVLVIVGLLIGGILKGQQLMENASITATVSQIKAIEAATTSFLDSYGALPGDLLDSASKIPGCLDTTCEDGDGFDPGNGIVGSKAWNLKTYQPIGNVAAADRGGRETLLFWYSLQQVGLINAVKDTAMTATNEAFGTTVPRAEIAGGFWAGYTNSASTTNAICGPTAAIAATCTAPVFPYSLLGTVLALVAQPAGDETTNLIVTDSPDMNAVVPSIAGAIDRKVDDGNPSSGYVQAFGTADCISGTTLYNESNEKLDCGLYINIVPQN